MAAARPVSVPTTVAFQKDCIISNTSNIATGGFGPCYVLMGHDPRTKHSFLAHIDDTTHVESLSQLFDQLRRLGVVIADLQQVRLMGGWASGESGKWGAKIITWLQRNGIPRDRIDLSCYQVKPRVDHDRPGQILEELAKSYFTGGLLNVSTGEFKLFAKRWDKIELQQTQKTEEAFEALMRRRVPTYNSARDKYSMETMYLANELMMSEPEKPLNVRVVN